MVFPRLRYYAPIGSPPAAPSGLSSQKVPGQNRVNTFWTDNATDETHYEAEKRTNGGAWTTLNNSIPANETDVSDLGVSVGENVQHRIRAVNGFGASVWVESPDVVCVADSPSSPDLAAQPGTNPNTEVDLSWSVPSGTWAQTEIQRSSSGPGSGFVTIATTSSPTVAYTDTPGAAGSYWYRARHLAGACGLASGYSGSVQIDLGASPVVDPPVLAVTVLDETQIQLSWTAVAHATSYEVAASDTAFPPGGPNWTTDLVATVAAQTWTETALDPKNTRHYVVRGINTGSQGPNSNAGSGTTWPRNPIALSAELDCSSENGGDYDVDLTFSADGSGRNLRIRANPNGTGWSILATVVPGTTTYKAVGQTDRSDFDVELVGSGGSPQVFGSGSATVPSWCAQCGHC